MLPTDAAVDGRQLCLRFGLGRRRYPPELEPLITRMYTVQHQQVEVDVLVQRAAEALDQGHGVGLPGGPLAAASNRVGAGTGANR